VSQEDSHSSWRDLTDNQGKGCGLLKEPERLVVRVKSAYSKATCRWKWQAWSITQGFFTAASGFI